jgi:hypothetical protein
MKRHDLLHFACLAWQFARKQLPEPASKFAPKRDTQPALLACLCLKEYVHLAYRGAEALLASAQELRAALALRAVPDHSTLWWFQRYKVKPRLLADGGDDSEANHRWWREDLGLESIMPPVTGRPSRGVTTCPDRRQGQLAFPRQV